VNSRVAASERLVEQIDAILLDGVSDPDRLSQLARLSSQLVLQRAVEDEVAAFLGRARYERVDQPRGSRNGHRPRRIQTAEGELSVQVPRSATAWSSSSAGSSPTPVRSPGPGPWRRWSSAPRGRTDRGRNIEDLAREAGLGQLSRSSVSRLCRELRDRYRAFRARSLAGVRLLALFLDAVYLPVRPAGPREGVLVAWGFDLDGERVLLDVCLGQRERADDWLELGRGLTTRGLAEPLLVVGDGAPGLMAAIGELWPGADRQRCAVHRLRNVLAKLPKNRALHDRIRAAYWAALDEAVTPDEAEAGLRTLVGELERDYPSAAACLADDLPALTVHLRYPHRLRKRWRSSNLLERSLGEVKRRTKVMGRFPGETSCLTLAWAVMDLVIAGGRGLALTLDDRRQIGALRAARSMPPEEVRVA
jgi:transposase-like protein